MARGRGVELDTINTAGVHDCNISPARDKHALWCSRSCEIFSLTPRDFVEPSRTCWCSRVAPLLPLLLLSENDCYKILLGCQVGW